MRTLALALVFSLGTSAVAQPKTTKVYFGCTCDDQVGALWASSLRDLLSTSPRYATVNAPETVVAKDADGQPLTVLHWQVNAVSSPAGSNAAAISITVMIGSSFFVTHLAQSCPLSQVRTCAADALASFDNTVARYDATH